MKKILSFLLFLLGLFLVGCNNETLTTSVVPSTSPSRAVTTTVDSKENNLSLSKTNVTCLIDASFDIEVTNPKEEALTIAPSDYSLVTVTIKSKTLFNIKLLKEGKGTIAVSTKNSKESVINVEVIDLKITNEEDHLNVNNELSISISKEVEATYSVSNDTCSINGNIIKAVKEGSFDVVVRYGDIEIKKSFDSYKRTNTINELDRENVFIRYYGRNVHTNGTVKMDNIVSGFEVTFYGSELKATLCGWYGTWYGKTKVSVMIDRDTDTTKNIITIDNGTRNKEYTLVTGLDEGIHTVKLLKRTEALSTYLTLKDVKTDGYFKPVDNTEKLKIEAYGDSITAGYGNLRGKLADTTNSDYQNGLQTYATYTAQALNAEINVQARSGIGMYTSNGIDDSLQVNSLFDYVLYEKDYKWNLSNYTPDIVIINLGTNDFWNPSVFSLSEFKDQYIKFVRKLASIYGESTAFILCSGFMEDNVYDTLVEIQAEIGDDFTNPLFLHKFNRCAGGHPIFEEHLAGSEELVKLIKDNNLDAIHRKEEIKEDVKESKNETVTVKVKAALKDQLPSYISLSLKGLTDFLITLEKEDEFTYSKSIEINEGDYEVSFLINGNADYSESRHLNRTINIRKDQNVVLELNSFLIIPENENPNPLTFGWGMSKHLFEERLTSTDKTNATIMNTNWMAGFVTRKSTLSDDYKISVDIKSNVTDYVNTYIGVVPYYLDNHNFVVCYLQYSSSDTIKSIGCTGMINGNDLGWNDFWNFANTKPNIKEGTSLTIERHSTDLTISFMGISETKKIVRMNEANEEVGLYCSSKVDVFYRNFKQEEAAKGQEEKENKWELTGHLFDASFTSNSSTEVTLTNAENWMAAFVVKETAVDNTYIEALIQNMSDNFTQAQDTYIGLVPYYVDNGNFVVVYLQWTSERKIKSIGITGMIDSVDIGWNDIWDFANLETTLSTGQLMKVIREDSKITVSFGGTTYSKTISQLSAKDNIYSGVWCLRTTTTFSNIVIEELSK